MSDMTGHMKAQLAEARHRLEPYLREADELGADGGERMRFALSFALLDLMRLARLGGEDAAEEQLRLGL
jgi:hypothetical protein